jgi:hypothetical protein
VLIDDAPMMTAGGFGQFVPPRAEVWARWQLADGSVRTGLVAVEGGLRAGARVPIWIDESGRWVEPPMSLSDAVARAALVAAGLWSVAVGLLALGCGTLHHLLDRRRYQAWETEWARIEPEWHGHRP